MIRPSYQRQSTGAFSAVTYAQAADHLRVDSSADQAYIEALIAVASDYFETITGRVIASTTWTR